MCSPVAPYLRREVRCVQVAFATYIVFHELDGFVIQLVFPSPSRFMDHKCAGTLSCKNWKRSYHFRPPIDFDSLEDRLEFVMPPLLRHADCLNVFPIYLQLQSLRGLTTLRISTSMPIVVILSCYKTHPGGLITSKAY